ncbi:MAG TPA: outer membrane protein assembly factor BamA [Nitrospirae bacterium]|nr:outer membrane protein assembly factor BamA precursor [bacterium BMS3Abin10]GBE38158.1 outer membrane protein assembly factor BamA precursor [bacterium BMS3Bbin08]HDH51451.1 outer membrane protein assembly factor BamA [Nitrospirota bacterium]HDK16865.1 outer membrane protein assembly factor BamA [Nitrospirota bacterium]HDZ83988.1 outer membrane protein assembly factor BamA [Nitrospirota bacterium]
MRTGNQIAGTEEKVIKKIALVCILIFVSHFFFLFDAFATETEGMIRKIEVEGLTRIRKEELIDMICFREGSVINRDLIREGIRRAFKKGIFLDIEAVTEPYEDGVKLKYIITEIPIVKRIEIHGNDKIPDRKIRKAFMFRKGGDFREDLIDKAKADLRYFYYKKGFPDARVDISFDRRTDKGEVTLNLQIEEGRPLIVKSINVLPEARAHMKMTEGEILDIDRVEKDITRLKKYYKKKEHLKPVIGPYEFKDGELIIPVIPGPKLEVVFKGRKKLSEKRLLKVVPFEDEEEVTDALLLDTVSMIKRLYQKEGYYHVQLSAGIEREDDLIRVTFLIFEGERVILRDIKFEGVSLSTEAIKAIIPLRENKPYDKNLLGPGRESITGFYGALGYLHADVTDVREDFLKNGQELNLIFVIDQGPEIKIRQIDIKGNRAVSGSEIEDILQINEGDPYNEIDIGDARFRILAIYNRLGYINAEVEVERKIEGNRAAVIFIIKEGGPFMFGKVIIRGNEKTKRKIIWRELTIKEGAPYNYEAIFNTRQNLYKLGIFSEISIKPIETSNLVEHAVDHKDVNKQDVLIDIKEGNPGAVEFGLGYADYERIRGFLDISYSNIGGYDRRIGLRTELSSINERYILNFTEPWLFNKPSLLFNASLTKEDIRSINIDTKEVKYKVDRLSFVAGVDKQFTPRLKGTLNYEYSIVDTVDVKPGVILSREDTGTLGISSVSPSLFYDTRDNPFDPTSGVFSGIMLKFASSIFGSESEFIKSVLRGAWYKQIRKGLVFAFALRGGVAHGMGDTSELPLIERFFLGGRTTVRGFDHDMVGPKGTDGNPTGGNVFILENAEFRISLGKGFGTVIFFDSGNVWKKIRDVDFDVRYTAGTGLRYNTPVGPLRVDYGHKLDRKEGESAGEFHFTFGHAF